LDEVYSFINREKINLVIVSVMPYGINLEFYDFEKVVSVCRQIKKKNNIPIVLGGIYARAFKSKLFDEPKGCFDYLIVKEDEHSILELVNSLERRSPLTEVNNLIFKNNGRIIANKCFDDMPDLDHYPLPDRNLFPILKYKGMLAKNKHYTQIVTSRGCNNKCAYCLQPSLQGSWRGMSAGRVIEEIQAVVDQFGIREFHFEDPNFFGGGIERVKDFCHKLIEKGLNIKWQCPNGIPVSEFKDEAVLKLMAESGCYSLCLGIETFDKEILKKINRISNFEVVCRIIKSAHKQKLEVTGYFIMGFPGQSKASVKRDIYLSKRLGLDFIKYSIFRVVPGSMIHIQNHSQSLDTQELRLDLKALKRLRAIASLTSCFRPRPLLFILKSLARAYNPFIFFHRGANHIVGTDLRL